MDKRANAAVSRRQRMRTLQRKYKWFVNSTTCLHDNVNDAKVLQQLNELNDGNMSMAFGEILPRDRKVEEEEKEEEPNNSPATMRAAPTRSNSFRGLRDGAIDLEREKTKMESFDCYILVSVLTATASFSTLQSFVPLDDVDNESLLSQFLMIATQISAGLSTICGLYATVVFSLTVLYAKSAIGMHKDEIYKYFLKQTGAVRVRGFQAFSASLLMFAVEASLVTFLRVPAVARIPVLFVVVALLYYIYSDWQCIVETATVIYTGILPKKESKRRL